jgi:hypothetical protein
VLVKRSLRGVNLIARRRNQYDAPVQMLSDQ